MQKLCEDEFPRKYVSEVVSGHQRPESLKAWRIGQALQHCGAWAWTGIAMLYAAGHYSDYVGVSVHLARQCRLDPAEYETAAEYIRTVPIRFGSFLALERFLADRETVDADEDDDVAHYEFDERGLVARWSCAAKLDPDRLQRAWDHWQDAKDAQSPVAVRARSISLSKELRVALREREAQAYLNDILSNPACLDEQTSARL